MLPIDLETINQLVISKNDAEIELNNLRLSREINQDNTDYLISTIDLTIQLESYVRAIETVFKFNANIIKKNAIK